MHVTAIKTHKVTAKDTDILKFLDKHLISFSEKSVLAVTSKIVSIMEGSVVKVDEADKDALVEEESEYYLPASENIYNFALTIRNNSLVPTAGIDESNGNGYYILWPRDPQETANQIREYLCRRFGVRQAGVIITDSKTTPLRWGVTGTAVSHSGFQALRDLIGKPDIFGRDLHVTKVNIMDGLAASAVLVMGESDEQTPLGVVTDVPFVEFQDRNPTREEIASLHISMEEDLYASLLKNVQWRKGKRA